MNAWPPRLGGTIHVGRARWRVVAFGIRDGERWVMATRSGVVYLMPWINLKADHAWAGGRDFSAGWNVTALVPESGA